MHINNKCIQIIINAYVNDKKKTKIILNILKLFYIMYNKLKKITVILNTSIL